MPARFAFVVSTAGSVMNRVLHAAWVRGATRLVVADRPCGGLDVAVRHQVAAELVDAPSIAGFCEGLEQLLESHRIDYVVSFYTNFYSTSFRERYRDRIVNFHPSLLPAFKGMDGFGDGLRYHVKLIGSTVELIKDVMDEGKIVMQTAFPADPSVSEAALRHRLFEQQCRSLIQVMKWLDEDRVTVQGDRVSIAGARFSDPAFVPALEFSEAVNLNIPQPDSI